MKKFFLSNTFIDKLLLKNLPFEFSISENNGSFSYAVEDFNSCFETENFLTYTDGYIRNLDLEVGDKENSTGKIIQNEFKNWPLPENISGSFSCTVLDKRAEEIYIFNDLFGLYPLYYLIQGDTFFVSNSIILMGMITGAEVDAVGIIQRSLGPEFANVGRRTILKNCKRLLPGEWLRLNSRGKVMENRFDNSLFQRISTPHYNKVILEEYWKNLKKEVSYCLNNFKKVNLALSGGVDSRIILGAIPSDKKITCHTFGGQQNYETKIASRLSELKGANFKNYEDLSLYFPENEILQKYTRETEALYLGSWLEILENVKESVEEPFITGDFTTALTGRIISRFASKEYKQRNFFKLFIRNKDYEFTNATPDNFLTWKEGIIKKYLWNYRPQQLRGFKYDVVDENLKNILISDLEELFHRIEAHGLPYAELYDELFLWYTHTRMKSAKQLLIASSKYKVYAPAMSNHILRAASNIHPNQRLDLRFITKLFRNVPELKLLSNIPTSQVPFLPARFPNFIKFPVWGMRSALDQFFIKRLIRAKDPEKRYRLFKSINWVKVYQNPKMEERLNHYFTINFLGEEIFQRVKNQSISRRKMEQWPLSNMDALSIASLNSELRIINEFRNQL